MTSIWEQKFIKRRQEIQDEKDKVNAIIRMVRVCVYRLTNGDVVFFFVGLCDLSNQMKL